jgi:hypothetical protein
MDKIRKTVETIQYGIVSDDAKRLPESVQQQVLVSAGLSPALRERVQVLSRNLFVLARRTDRAR